MTGMDDKRLEELARRALFTGQPRFTRFLEPSESAGVRAAAGRNDVTAAFWGGFEGAERCVAAFYGDEAPGPEDYPIAALRIEWNAKFASPAHRDLLGAATGLGIERDTLGDIAMGRYRGEPCAYLFAHEDMADYIAANLTSAGRAALKVSRAVESPELLPPEGETLRVTVQQARLDAVVAAGYHLSRAEAQRLIAAGLVKLDHVPCLRGDARLDEGSLVSVRGHGRLKLVEFQGQSRRGRLAMTLFRYGR